MSATPTRRRSTRSRVATRPLTNYNGVAHPSLPNYLALVSGSTHGITGDCTDCVVPARNLADTLAAAGKTWKTYAEDLPSPGFTGGSSGRYAKKHDPFLYFRDIARSRARRAHVVPFNGSAATCRPPAAELLARRPEPLQRHARLLVATGDAWLKTNVVPLLHSPELRGGVVFVVFDEGTSDTGGGGHIDALALGPTVARDSSVREGHEPLRPAPHDRGRLAPAATRLLAHEQRRSAGSGREIGAARAGAESVPGRCSPRSHAHSKNATASSATAPASRRSPSPSHWGLAGIANASARFARRRRCTTSARSRCGRRSSASRGRSRSRRSRRSGATRRPARSSSCRYGGSTRRSRTCCSTTSAGTAAVTRRG